MRLRTLKDIGWFLIAVNLVVGPIIKLHLGYENVHWLLVGPRMVFMVGVGVFMTGLYVGEHLTLGSQSRAQPYKREDTYPRVRRP